MTHFIKYMHCPTYTFRFTDLLSTLQMNLGPGDHFSIKKSLTTFTFEQTSGHQTLFIFCDVEPHHSYMPLSLKYFINLSTYKKVNSINFHKCFDISAILYKQWLRFRIFTTLSWNLQYGSRCARIQRNILKGRTWLVEAKLAGSKWTNHQPHTVWSLVFAFSVLPACSRVSLFQQFR